MQPSVFPSAFDPFWNGETEHVRVFKSGLATQALACAELSSRGQNWVLLVPGLAELRELSALLELFLPCPQQYAPVWERPWFSLGAYSPVAPRATQWGARMAVMYALAYGNRPRGLLMTVDNLLPFWPEAKTVREANLLVRVGEELSMELIMEQAVIWGYESKPLVERIGDMAVRGDIMDIFVPGYPQPLRFDFFGDVLEAIRFFDPATQNAVGELKECIVLPVCPCVLSSNKAKQAGKWWHKLQKTGELTAHCQEELLAYVKSGNGFFFPGLFSASPAKLEDLLPPQAVFVLGSAGRLRNVLEDVQAAWREYLEKNGRDSGLNWPKHLIYREAESARRAWLSAPQLVFEELTMGVEKRGVDLSETQISSFSDIFWKPAEAQRPWSALTEALHRWTKAGDITLLSFRNARSRTRFLRLAQDAELDIQTELSPNPQGIYALISPLRKGMELAWRSMRILSEDVLHPEKHSATAGQAVSDFKGLARYDDLSDGDLLVHRDYGLGRFGGLQSMEVGTSANDYLLLYFDSNDRLYIPVDRINLIQRYKGPEGASPVLDKLGGSCWSRAKAKARKAIEKIAHDLVEMYAFRKVVKGFSYSEPDELYREFESTFGFDETPDQEKAVRDVLADMAKPEPMDRLVCGDVGFGKTEIALRAAFRAASEGKQVALLCPTTVLAEQHYQTFLKRMDSFPINIALLSRFVPRARQKRVVEQSKRGEIDILIGTHRLLSADVRLPELGLLILDEEQRFGVKHKEKLKTMRQDIDVLALTATPIPRTLQLSLSGVRELSLIETPPVDRKVVETALIERDDAMLRNILNRELERGGQVFWVYNRVRGLARTAEFVKNLVPEAKVGMAHGQMSETVLEKTMHQFWHREINILVCTSIVESGLDFPNANTLIVDQAQLFGLGQLYQLRGRVGRSERQAYAYFIVPSVDDLSELAQKRLRIILEMDYLGAGFKIAMEDLRLRGAGNILGEVQSGQIARVGLDLFLEMLEEEVQRVRGEAPRIQAEPEISVLFSANLPAEYIADAKDRLYYYRALSAAREEFQRAKLLAEMRDRFGHLPLEAATFLEVLALKDILRSLRATSAELHSKRVVLSWSKESGGVSPAVLLAWLDTRDFAALKPPGTLELRCVQAESVLDCLSFIREQLGILLANIAVEDTTDMDGS